MKIIDKVYKYPKDAQTKEEIVNYIIFRSCPSDYGFKDVESRECVHCDCKTCWNREVEDEE